MDTHTKIVEKSFSGKSCRTGSSALEWLYFNHGGQASMTPIRSIAEYRQSIETVKGLKHRMWMLASQRGNLDPEVIRVSQEIDEYIVSIQRYWQHHQPGETLIG